MDAETLVKWTLINKLAPMPYVSIDQYEDANMLEIVATSSDPDEAVALANRLAEGYIANRIKVTTQDYGRAKSFIEQQIGAAREEYYKSLRDYKEFKVQNKTVDISLETQNTLNKIMSVRGAIEDNERGIVELDRSIAATEAKIKDYLKLRKDSEEYSLSDQVKTLKQKINELLTSAADKSVDLTTEHPDYRRIEKQLDKVRELVKAEDRMVLNAERYVVDPVLDSLKKKYVDDFINREVSHARSRILTKFLNAYETELRKLPVSAESATKLELATAVYKDIYGKLLGYLTQANIAESIALADIRVVERASHPEKPNFPKKLLNYFLGIALGLFWGLGAAFFREYTDATIGTAGQIKKMGKYPLLGTVASMKRLRDRRVLSARDAGTPEYETFRSLRNSMRFAAGVQPWKVISVMSAKRSDGRSSIAANLAVQFGMEGKKVALVDLDLRSPSLHSFFNESGSKGVTSVLAEGRSVAEAAAASGIAGLDLFAGGPSTSDPGGLIESPKMRQFIDALRESYEVVVIDSPPAAETCDDAFVIGALVDCVLLVIAAGRTTPAEIGYITDKAESAGLKISGVVLNKVLMSSAFWD